MIQKGLQSNGLLSVSAVGVNLRCVHVQTRSSATPTRVQLPTETSLSSQQHGGDLCYLDGGRIRKGVIVEKCEPELLIPGGLLRSPHQQQFVKKAPLRSVEGKSGFYAWVVSSTVLHVRHQAECGGLWQSVAEHSGAGD